MKTFKTFFAVVMCSLVIAACAKKDNDFANKAKKNALGATARNGAVANDAAAAGVLFDVIGFRTVGERDSAQGRIVEFETSLMLDNQVRPVQIVAVGMQQSNAGTTTLGTYTIRVEGVCGTADCNPYYFMATAYRNNQIYGQVGYKFVRKNSTSEQDVYQLFSPATAVPSLTAMVNYLNQPIQ